MGYSRRVADRLDTTATSSLGEPFPDVPVRDFAASPGVSIGLHCGALPAPTGLGCQKNGRKRTSATLILDPTSFLQHHAPLPCCANHQSPSPAKSRSYHATNAMALGNHPLPVRTEFANDNHRVTAFPQSSTVDRSPPMQGSAALTHRPPTLPNRKRQTPPRASPAAGSKQNPGHRNADQLSPSLRPLQDQPCLYMHVHAAAPQDRAAPPLIGYPLTGSAGQNRTKQGCLSGHHQPSEFRFRPFKCSTVQSGLVVLLSLDEFSFHRTRISLIQRESTTAQFFLDFDFVFGGLVRACSAFSIAFQMGSSSVSCSYLFLRALSILKQSSIACSLQSAILTTWTMLT